MLASAPSYISVKDWTTSPEIWIMDLYHKIHGHDVASFSEGDAHRLPTVSASDALNSLEKGPSNNIATGLDNLDKVLLGTTSADESKTGGIRRGQVTEIWGAPGTGATSIGIQLAANAMREGGGVVWVDCFQTVSDKRMTKVVEAVRKVRGNESEESSQTDSTLNLTHYDCLTLPHLLALILRPNTRTVPADTTIFILSSVSALINSALPKSRDARSASKQSSGPAPAVKRRQALQAIMKAVQSLASSRHCAVVLLSQCATKMQSDRGAALTPAINANIWEQGISTRIVLFRDWLWQNSRTSSVFLVGLQKLDGKDLGGAVDHILAFKVEATGISSIDCDVDSLGIEGNSQAKRKLDQTGFEVPDSEDEDYGWGDEDEGAMPAPPPQWQGSEDILLGHDVGRSDDEDEAQASDSEENE